MKFNVEDKLAEAAKAQKVHDDIMDEINKRANLWTKLVKGRQTFGMRPGSLSAIPDGKSGVLRMELSVGGDQYGVSYEKFEIPFEALEDPDVFDETFEQAKARVAAEARKFGLL